MRRCRATLDDIAAWQNLVGAFGKAAKGKRGRSDVEAFRADLDRELDRLGREIHSGTVALDRMRSFSIHDPKPRIIHAPCFRERVLHHALMNVLGPRFEQLQVHESFACREGKGSLAAVHHAQHCLRRAPWFAQIDIAQYFPSIPHDVLMARIARLFSDHGVLALLDQIVRTHENRPGHGLPIGALTSQIFANSYLATADRLVLEHPLSRGYVRYMDDLVWWADSRPAAREILRDVVHHIEDQLRLTVKRPCRVGRSVDGLAFCGYRIHKNRLLLSRRRRHRYIQARRSAERAFSTGEIDVAGLQRRMDAALAITAHADAAVWRREELARHPLAAHLAYA